MNADIVGDPPATFAAGRSEVVAFRRGNVARPAVVWFNTTQGAILHRTDPIPPKKTGEKWKLTVRSVQLTQWIMDNRNGANVPPNTHFKLYCQTNGKAQPATITSQDISLNPPLAFGQNGGALTVGSTVTKPASAWADIDFANDQNATELTVGIADVSHGAATVKGALGNGGLSIKKKTLIDSAARDGIVNLSLKNVTFGDKVTGGFTCNIEVEAERID